MKDKHPDWSALLQHVEKDMDGDLARHLAECPSCSETAQRIRDILATLKAGEPDSPPTHLINRTLELLESEIEREDAAVAPMSRRLADAVAKLAARLGCALTPRLVFPRDGEFTPSLNLRGAARSSSVLIFDSEEFTISLSFNMQDQGASKRLSGQVCPKRAQALPARRLALLEADEDINEATLSEFGEFCFEDPGSGQGELVLVLGDTALRLRL